MNIGLLFRLKKNILLIVVVVVSNNTAALYNSEALLLEAAKRELYSGIPPIRVYRIDSGELKFNRYLN